MTLIAAVLALGLYPPLTRPIGVITNAGLLGFIILIIATLFAWIACTVNRDRRLTRWFFEIPVTIAASYLLVNEMIVHIATLGYYLVH